MSGSFHLVILAVFLSLLTGSAARADDSIIQKPLLLQKYERFADLRGPETKPFYGDDDPAPRPAAAADPEDEEARTPMAPPPLAALPALPPEKPSAVEAMYSRRASEDMRQFGYDLFGVPVPETRAQLNAIAQENPVMPMGAVQDDFILASGDELEIIFTGQRTGRSTYKIDSRGYLVVEDFPPIPAEGRSVGQVRLSVEMAAHNLHNTEAYVSLSSVRQINALIVGHVKRPGRQTLTVFHTVMDALMEAGGVEKTGSLRRIKLVRGGKTIPVDLYALLLNGAADVDLRLRDGDRLIVPPIGPTAAVAGEVKRPGIFELDPEDGPLSLERMLQMGGGVLAPGKNRYLKLGITPQGQELVTEISAGRAPAFGDGSILLVSKGREKRAGMIELEGHTLRPGMHALPGTPTLATLLASDDMLGPDIYPLIGVLERRDTDQLTRHLSDFPLRLVLKGGFDLNLAEGDIVHVFSNEQIAALAGKENIPQHKSVGQNEEETPPLDESIASFLSERSVFVRGAVRVPGPYPVSGHTALEGILAAAGGATLEADTGNIEISRAPREGEAGGKSRSRIDLAAHDAGDVTVQAGDAIRINRKFQRTQDKSVFIIGEVLNPGRYDLLPGDKVSDLMLRAGGLTQDAYPDGAIFSRESERKAEEARYRAQAREMKSALAAALEQRKENEKIDPQQIAEARALAEELESAQGAGRITVETDPAVLEVDPDQDMLLEAGDRIYIPKRSLTVRVNGEVLSPASLQFRSGKDPSDYIREAGGFTYNADKDRSFVLYPDGSAQPLDGGGWNYNSVLIPPGSTIVVPRDPKPFDFLQSAKDVSQILSNLAITALFIDDVRDGD